MGSSADSGVDSQYIDFAWVVDSYSRSSEAVDLLQTRCSAGERHFAAAAAAAAAAAVVARTTAPGRTESLLGAQRHRLPDRHWSWRT